MNNLAFVFPGQGSQSVGMIAEMFSNHQVVKDTLSEASDTLSMDFSKIILEGPAEDLNRTDNTQPALLAAGVAIFRLWQQKSDISPAIMAGHSLGEYTALVCAESLSFTDALKLVQMRGQFMIDAVPVGAGAMAAILGLDNHLVEQACEESAEQQIVSAVNYNSPGQLVIAGNKEAVERAIDRCISLGAKRAMLLPVTAPCHCDLLKDAASKLTEQLQLIEIKTPSTPVINNVDVKIATSSSDISDALIRQLYSPVRWTDTVQLMQQKGIDSILECGPGKVLSGLCRRIDRSITALATCDQTNFDKSLETLK